MNKRIELPQSGFSTRVIEDGEGPGVLLLHGSPDSATEWSAAIDALKGRRRCLAPDLPGLGESSEPPPSFDYGPEVHRRFIDEVLAVCGVPGKVTLVVHDIGGVFGLPWAASNLERLEGVVITNTVAFAGFPWFPIARTWGADGALGRLRARASMWAIGQRGGALFKRIMTKQCPDLPPADLERMTHELALNPIAKRSSLRLFRRMTAPAFFDGYAEHLRRLVAAVPVRVVWGERDRFIAPRWADAFGALRVERLPNGGHWVPITAAAQVALAVLGA